MVYRDTSPLDPDKDYTADELAKFILEKMYGQHTREAMARSLLKANEVAEWARDVAQQLIDGSFDEGVLNTAIEQKLLDLETQYAPNLTSLENEVENARGNEASLGDNLNSVNRQLAQTAEDLMNEFLVRSSPRYGRLTMPEDFIELDFMLHRHGNGLISHSVDLESYKKGQIIYVSDEGSNTTGDGTESNPYRTVHRAIYKANNTVGTDFVINVDQEIILRAEFANEANPAIISNKNIAIINRNKEITHVAEGQSSERGTILQVGGERQPKLTWVLEGGNVYKANRSAVEYVVDLTYIDKSNNTVIKLEKANSVADCQAVKGSFYKTSTEVYVHTFDSREPDKNIIPIMLTDPLNFELTNSTLYLEGFYFHSYNGLSVKGDLQSKFIQSKCRIGKTTTLNGLNLLDVGLTMSFNTIIHDSFKDCFNYHYYGISQADIRKVLAFEYYCEGFGAGVEDTMEGNNATTMHEGANILRVGFVGYKTRGTPCADINGSYSVLFDCHMSDSVAHPNSIYNNAYYFYTDANKSGLGAKAYLENCGGTGTRQDILLDGGTELTLRSYHEGLENITKNGAEVVIV